MKSHKGFTIIELVVVMAIFLFIIGAAISIFLSIITNQRKILAEQQLINQISYVEEYMSKALRMAKTEPYVNGACLTDSIGTTDYPGYIYMLTHYDTNPPYQGFYRGIKFFNQTDNICQEFFLDGTGATNDPYILKEIKGNSTTSHPITPVPLTPVSMKINFVRFSINGGDGSATGQHCGSDILKCGASDQDGVQPKVTILLNIKIAGDSEEPNRTIQTTISRRNLNLKH